MKKVGVGLLGLGFMARTHSYAIREIPEAEIVAIGSKFPDEFSKYDEFSEKTLKYKVETRYTEVKEMVKDPKIDAIICTIPARFSEPYITEIVNARKPVLVECPPCDTLDKIKKLAELAKNRQAKLMPGHCYRFAPCFAKSKELIEKGEIGVPTMIYFKETVPAEILAKQWPPGNWIWNKEIGGPVPTMSVFYLDLARWILNSEPVSVYGTVRWQDLPQFGSLGYWVTSTIKFKNEACWVSEISGAVAQSTGPAMRLEIFGEKGNAILCDGPTNTILFGQRKKEQQVWTFDLSGIEQWGHKQQDEYFLKSVVMENKEPMVKMEDSAKAMEMSLAILESAKTGKPVYF